LQNFTNPYFIVTFGLIKSNFRTVSKILSSTSFMRKLVKSVILSFAHDII
jgi:hypothetical protein